MSMYLSQIEETYSRKHVFHDQSVLIACGDIHPTDDKYSIPEVVDCTDVLREWVYPQNGDLTRLLNTPPRELPEYVRRFTQDIYNVCVYIQQDM